MSDEAIPRVNAADWESRVLRAARPVLVDFSASWCGPCRLQTGELAALAEDMGDRMDVLQVDIDAEEDLARRYDVRAVPAMVLFRDGEEAERLLGLTQGAALRDFVRRHAG